MIRNVAVAVALLGLVTPASAQNFKFLSGNPYSNPTLTVGGSQYRVSPYRGKFLSMPGQPEVDIFCVDFSHAVRGGQMWTAEFTSLASADLSATYGMRFRGWTQEIALERYKASAFLAAQFNTGNKSAWPTMQAAIWSLMGQDAAGTSTTFPLALNTSQQQYLNDALAGASSVDGSQWTVISDVAADANATQEFLTQTVVPEPETVLLLASGLLAMGAVAYFRGFTA